MAHTRTSDAHAIPEVHYASKSSPDEKESTDDQLARLAAEHPEPNRKHRRIVGTFSEENASGYKGNRGPQLEAAITTAISAAEEHDEAELYVFHSSRLARGSGKKDEARALGKLFYDLREKGVRLRSLTDDEFVTREELIGMASSIAHKYSSDVSYHVKRSKRQQFEKGDRLGGPVPDGYIGTPILNERTGKRDRTEYSKDPDREKVISRAVELALAGMPDASIARKLNAEGYRTRRRTIKSGQREGEVIPPGRWTRRRIQDLLTNPFYAGMIARGRSKTGAAVEVVPGDHPTYFDPGEWEAFMKGRARRDLGRGKHKGGRPNRGHLLADLATCARCGGVMRPRTSSYRRKDGTKRRSYLCANAHLANGGCHAPPISAALIEPPLVDHLGGLFLDFEQWRDAVTSSRSREREEIEGVVAAEREALKSAMREERKFAIRYREHVESDPTLARADALNVEEAAERREQAEHRIGELEAILSALDGAEPVDAMLDFFTELSAAVRGALDREGVPEVNAGLRERFAAFWLDTTPEGVVTIRPELLPDSPAVVAQEWAESEWANAPHGGGPEAWAEFMREHPPCVTRLVTDQDGEAVPALMGPEQNERNAQE